MAKPIRAAYLVWHAITPLHVGTGQESAGVIDLPVAREAATDFPVIPASSIKGVFRDGQGLKEATDAQGRTRPVEDIRQEQGALPPWARRFGYADRTGTDGKQVSGAGELTFTDARLLALATPSFKGTFAWVTAPLVVRRLMRDRRLLGFADAGVTAAAEEPGGLEVGPGDPATDNAGAIVGALTTVEIGPGPGDGGADVGDPIEQALTKAEGDDQLAVVASSSRLLVDLPGVPRVVLNDLDFVADSGTDLAPLAEMLWPGQGDVLASRLCVVPDDSFAFLCQTGLEITPHIRLDSDTKTVVSGALWYEEAIPAESLLASFVLSSGDLAVLDEAGEHLQLGGKSTVGRGLVAINSRSRVDLGAAQGERA